MSLPLATYYRRLHYEVMESDGVLWLGFKPGMVHAIVKEVWNEQPLNQTDAERYYAEFSSLSRGRGNPYFRIVAHGGFQPEALAFELHGLAVSDESYIRSLSGRKHIELYPHNEAAYRAIRKGFERHRIGAVVQATGTGKSYLLARYIVDHAAEKILVFAPNVTILDEIQKVVGFQSPNIRYQTFQSLIYHRGSCELLKAGHILIDEFHHWVHQPPLSDRKGWLIRSISILKGTSFMNSPCRRRDITIFCRFRSWCKVPSDWIMNWTGSKEIWIEAVVQPAGESASKRNWTWHGSISKVLWARRR